VADARRALGRLRAIAKRWESAHVPLAIAPDAYAAVVRDLERALSGAGIAARARRAPWPYELPGKALALFGGPGVRALVPRDLTMLVRPDLEIVIHPTDLAFQGRQRAVARARAALVRELTFTQAYQTWTKEAQRLEDELARASRGEADLGAIGRALEVVDVDFEEWEILYRLWLQVRLRRTPLASDALVAEEPLPALSRPAAALVAAFRRVWPLRREPSARDGARRNAA
jgi:hypothetical protein